MRQRFSYKEISIVLGILVALAILTITWLNPATTQSSDGSLNTKPDLPAPAGTVIIEKLIHTVHSFR
jgi:hypothetical protein